MKAFLMFPDRNLVTDAKYLPFSETITADLELAPILSCMSRGDEQIEQVCSYVLLRPLESTDEILYRQSVLKDAFRHPETVRSIYNVCVQAEENRQRTWRNLSPTSSLTGTYTTAVRYLRDYSKMLRELRGITDAASGFESSGFINLFRMLKDELPDSYFDEIDGLLNELSDQDGLLVSTRPGSHLQGTCHVMRRKEARFRWKWLTAPSFSLPGRDVDGVEDLEHRKSLAINEISNVLAQSAEHLVSFFDMLRTELSFYTGCLNLKAVMEEAGMPVCIPEVRDGNDRARSWDNLYNGALIPSQHTIPVGNTMPAGSAALTIVTGANQGGKSTFLKSLGQAQLMAQSGMFVFANAFSGPIAHGVYTHFKKEEDSSLKSGKLDEELDRMEQMLPSLRPGTLVLFNESFTTTNDREGSEISRQITNALIEADVEVVSVTHLVAFAMTYENREDVRFLRAERKEDGSRSFRVEPGLPQETAYGEDLYNSIFG